MRLYLSSYQLGSRSEVFAAMVDGARWGYVVMNAVDGGDRARRIQAADRQLESLAALGLEADVLDLRDLSPRTLKQELGEPDFFWVNGGNAFTLRMAMRRSGLDDYLVDGLHGDRFAYGGFSAGACVLAPDLTGLEVCDPTSDCELVYGEVSYRGLGVLDRPFVPHLESPDHQEAEVMAAVADNYEKTGQPFWALRDGQVLLVDGEVTRLI